MTRTAKKYLVLARGRYGVARVVRISSSRPRLRNGECAVRVELSVPDEAFDPVFEGPKLAYEVGQVLRAPIGGKVIA